MPSHSSGNMRRRGTGSSSIGPEYANYMPTFPEHDEEERASRYDLESTLPPPHRASSFHSFLSEKQINDSCTDHVEDVQTDVLYPRYKASEDDHVDMSVFNRMVQDRTRKLSSGTLQLTRTPSRQNQLYGSGAKHEGLTGIRFTVYSSENGSTAATNLEELLTEEGQKVLASMVKSKGWWVDVLCPSVEEMSVLSKTFRIHPLTTEDIQAQEPREKVELFPNYTFVCFRAFDVDPVTDRIKPFNYYTLIFKEGLITFHFKRSDHGDIVRERCNQLKAYMMITPDWMNYALIDAITDSIAPIVLQVEMEAISIDELSLVLKESEQGDMLKRISRCRKKSTQLSRLLASKMDVIKSLMKRYEDRTRELEQLEHQQALSFPVQLNQALAATVSDTNSSGTTARSDNPLSHTPAVINSIIEMKKSITDTLLYLGDIQDHVVTMAQNINHYDRILHRAHTNYLAQVNLELTQTYVMTNSVMNRLTFLATVFIPLTLIGGLWGMNVKVPGIDFLDLSYFYWILAGMAIYCVVCVYFGKRTGLL